MTIKNIFSQRSRNMNILVINAGSSSLKYQLIDMKDEKVVAKGNVERIGIDPNFPTHAEAFEKVMKDIGDVEIHAVGHRAVHGGELFSKTAKLDNEVIQKIDDLKEFAPLHNPANALAMRACSKVLPANIPQAAIFDTAFHSSIPDYAYTYGLPYECYEKYGVRKYGFHGTSHKFVSADLALRTNRDLKDMKIITCHLGNGSSITAIDGGNSVDTTMGFTPLDGVLMGTRCGNIDPSVVTYLQRKMGMTPAEIDDYMNKKSGLLGIGGFSDNREITDAANNGDKRAKLATTILRYGIRKYIGAYAAAMKGVTDVIFTGGIGENAFDVRRDACMGLEFMGIDFDEEKNAGTRGKFEEITKSGSRVKVWVVPTNEELLIARDTKELFGL
jgi:acetate kinase